MPVEGLTLEGYVDLVYRAEHGLVVVDYKTDAIGDDATLARPARRTTGCRARPTPSPSARRSASRVVACVFVFLDPDGAREVTVEGAALADAVDTVRALMASEREDPSPPAPLVLADP